MAFGNMRNLPEADDLPTLTPYKIKATELRNYDLVLDDYRDGRVQLVLAHGVNHNDRYTIRTNPKAGTIDHITRVTGLVTGPRGFSLDPDEYIIVYRFE